MKKFLKYAACLAILLMVVVLFTGCKVTGGGWFLDVVEEEETKCTFGLNAQGEWDEGVGWFVYKGQFQFNDHAGTKIHVEVMQMTQFGDDYAEFSGVAKSGEAVIVWVEDHGEPGPDAGDYIAIWINGLPLFDPPSYEGEILGGNIQVHEAKD